MTLPKLVRGVDYYVEEGKFVFTRIYHLKRGHCCNSRCRHCPYGLAPDPARAAADGVAALATPIKIVGGDPDPSDS